MSIEVVKITTISCDGMVPGVVGRYGCKNILESHDYDVDVDHLLEHEGWVSVNDSEYCHACKNKIQNG